MIQLDTSEVTVGDARQLSLTPDASLTSLEATFDAPSSEETVYELDDFTENGGTYTISHIFDEAGYWRVRVLAEALVGQEAESGFIRAISREPADLEFFTRDVWPEHLSAASMQADPTEIMHLAEQAERTVLDRYRETRPDGRFQIEGIDGEPLEEDVQLDGFVEDDQDNIDLDRTADALLDALRATVGAIVDWHLDRPDEAEHIEERSQGDRSVTFRDEDLPSSVYQPLRRFDERDVWH